MKPITITFSDERFHIHIPSKQSENFWAMSMAEVCHQVDDDLMGDKVQVWDFRDAPKRFRVLSEHGGDEDRLAVVPKELVCHINKMFFLKERHFANFVSKHVLDDGRVVFIGAHA